MQTILCCLLVCYIYIVLLLKIEDLGDAISYPAVFLNRDTELLSLLLNYFLLSLKASLKPLNETFQR